MSRLQLSLHACMYAVGNFTTNLCESWMHIRSKFDGGKQINQITDVRELVCDKTRSSLGSNCLEGNYKLRSK